MRRRLRRDALEAGALLRRQLEVRDVGVVEVLDVADIADLQLSPEQGSRLKSVAAQAAAQP